MGLAMLNTFKASVNVSDVNVMLTNTIRDPKEITGHVTTHSSQENVSL